MKICSKCKIEKDESEFGIRKSRPCGLASACKACYNTIYNRGESGKVSLRKYAKTDKRKLSNKRYKQSNKGLATQRKANSVYTSTPCGKLTRKHYEQSEHGRLIRQQCKIRRRERKRGIDTWLTKEDLKIIYERFNHKCFNCESIDRLSIDHHRPLLRGFGLTLENAVLLCKSCNSSKGSKMPEEFYSFEKLEILKETLNGQSAY